MLAKIRATSWFFFCRSLKMYAEPMPARVHLSKQTSTVPNGCKGMNTASVDGDNNAIKPLKKPNIPPDIGPHKTAAKTTGTSDKLILAGPICK